MSYYTNIPDLVFLEKRRSGNCLCTDLKRQINNLNNQIIILNSRIDSITPSPSPTPTSNIQYALIQERYPVGTVGEASTAGFERSRSFNTIAYSTIDGVRLDEDQVNLPAGTYYICCNGSATNAVTHRLRISNLSVDYGIGPMTSAVASGVSSVATINCVISSTENIYFYVFHYTGSLGTFGTPLNRLSQPEVYAELMILKLA